MAGLIDADGGLDFGTGLAWLTGGIGQAGLVITTATSAAALFLAEYGPYGMVMSFADDASIAIANSGGSLNYQSQGEVSNGALVGPGAKTTYSAPSPKYTEQSDGVLRFQAHNLCLWSEDISNDAWTKVATTGSIGGYLETTSTGQHSVAQSVSIVAGAPYTFTVEVQGVNRAYATILLTAGSANNYIAATIDLSTGAISQAGAGSANVAYISSDAAVIGDGYIRVSISGSSTITPVFAQIASATASTFSPDVGGRQQFTGATSSGLNVRKAHLRRTPSQPDYIKTTTAAAYDLPYVWSGGVRQSALWEWTAATNLALRSNDFTNASWAKSNMTTALTATGPDGVANGASTLTATAANATALQAITSASSSRLTSVYIKRRTGSGNIDLTQDNGTTWTAQTVTSSWTRVALWAVTSTNPTVGIRIVTSGDAVDVWCFQHETGTVATSPIVTYGAAVTRVADSPLALLNLFPSIGTAYTIYAKYKPRSASVATTAIRLDDTTTNELVSLGNNSSGAGLATVTDGGVSQVSATSGTITSSAFHRVAASVEANNVLLVVNGGAAVQDTSVTLPTLTRLLLGGAGGMELAQLAILPGARTEAQLQALGA